ncbi:GntR family transcriptional regulator [Brevibacillus sp. SAFN-007a]|uniref:GntR family transcriptional regulator n=1 Tax=Brevibacillus sp. SAFN-007a TaxID=3436862 RepID=UPI003F7E69E6
MQKSVHGSSAIPVFVQLKEQLKNLMEQRIYQSPDKLPTIRELSGFLRLRQQTVEDAYAALEAEGYVVLDDTGAVLIADQLPTKKSGQPEPASAAAQREQKGLPRVPKEARQSLLPKTQDRAKPTILFAECNVVQVQEYAVELEKATGYTVKPCLLKDLERFASSIRNGYYDLVVTTFLHIEEVQKWLDSLGDCHVPKVIGCLLESNLQSIRELQQLPPGSLVGIGGTTWEGAYNFRQSIVNAGMTHLELQIGSMEYPSSLDELLSAKPRLIVCTSIVGDYLKRQSRFLPLLIEDRYLNAQSVQYIQQCVEGWH